MKKRILYALFVTMLFLNGYGQSLWHKTSDEKLNLLPKMERASKPSKYELFSLNLDVLKSQLVQAPLDSQNVQSNLIIAFPNAEGKLENYKIYEAPVMEAGLANRFPDIKSYVGKGIEDATATIRFSVTLFGLHTMTLSGKTGTAFIDTYTKDLKNYIVYKKSDVAPSRAFECLVNDSSNLQLDNSNRLPENEQQRASDGQYRIYRLAMACTIEYAAYHVTAAGLGGGTLAQKKAAVLAAMNVTMTRINGLYEKDMSLRMNLVANNDLVIFITSDNFNNTNANTLINQSQTVIDANIGLANYDIGHTVSTGGGGLAQLFSPCSNSKARGITGSPAPVGDPYDIDYVAHEMGHQFGANHTQNNACNSNPGTAVEPGSGSTIMGYAGICAPNVQSNSDAHFHAVSIAEMSAFVAAGGNCSVNTANGNFAPVVNAGLDYTIPNGTAFVLKGSATDANGDALTYCWEQTNTETSTQPPLQTATNGPSFRSNPPVVSPNRYMPSLSSVIANNLAPTWEVVPTVARTMNFALTVRDNRVPTGGQTGRDNTVITTAAVGPFLVNTPNTNVSWTVGANEIVTWTVAGTTANNINAAYVDIFLSTDGGNTYPIQLASKVPNDGSETITVPNNPGANNRIMVSGYKHIFYDISNTNFAIVAAGSSFSIAFSGVAEGQNKSACQGADVSYNIPYAVLGGFSGTTTFSAAGNPAGSTVTFSPASTSTNGTVVMTISNTNTSTAGLYSIIVTGTSGVTTKTAPLYLELFNSNFGSMSLTTPADLAVGQGTSVNLTWAANSNATSYDVQLATDSGFTNIIRSGSTAATNYAVSGLSQATDYFWRILPKNSSCNGTYGTAYKFTTGVVTCVTTPSTNVPVTIPDNATATSTITIASGGIIDDINVLVSVNHTWIGDTVGTLTSPAGTVVQLYTRACDASPTNANINATFDDAGNPVVCPGITGIVTPASPLSVLNGQNSTGVWTLRIIDQANNDTGTLTNWSLNICTVLPALGIDENSFQDFALYPNPNNGNFTIKLKSNTSNDINVSVHDLRGRSIVENKYNNTGLFSQNIQLNKMQSGVYLVTIADGEKKVVKKIIIE